MDISTNSSGAGTFMPNASCGVAAAEVSAVLSHPARAISEAARTTFISLHLMVGRFATDFQRFLSTESSLRYTAVRAARAIALAASADLPDFVNFVGVFAR